MSRRSRIRATQIVVCQPGFAAAQILGGDRTCSGRGVAEHPDLSILLELRVKFMYGCTKGNTIEAAAPVEKGAIDPPSSRISRPFQKSCRVNRSTQGDPLWPRRLARGKCSGRNEADVTAMRQGGVKSVWKSSEKCPERTWCSWFNALLRALASFENGLSAARWFDIANLDADRRGLGGRKKLILLCFVAVHKYSSHLSSSGHFGSD